MAWKQNCVLLIGNTNYHTGRRTWSLMLSSTTEWICKTIGTKTTEKMTLQFAWTGIFATEEPTKRLFVLQLSFRTYSWARKQVVDRPTEPRRIPKQQKPCFGSAERKKRKEDKHQNSSLHSSLPTKLHQGLTHGAESQTFWSKTSLFCFRLFSLNTASSSSSQFCSRSLWISCFFFLLSTWRCY